MVWDGGDSRHSESMYTKKCYLSRSTRLLLKRDCTSKRTSTITRFSTRSSRLYEHSRCYHVEILRNTSLAT